MRTGLTFLVAAYMLSQFYRAFLAVLAPVLTSELGVASGDLATSSSLWFLAFAAMQLPIGGALDRFGPRRTAAILLALGGGGGSIAFATATGPGSIHLAMTLIGIGCAPVLMASYYIFARQFPPAAFGGLAGLIIAAGSLGNIAGAAPLAWTVEALGWRETLWGMVAITLAVAAGIAVFVTDPPPARAEGGQGGSVLDLLRVPRLWAILVMMLVAYGPAASIRGLWAGPWLRQLDGAGIGTVGTVTLAMALAMVAGNLVYGPAGRICRSWKGPILIGNTLMALCLAALWLLPPPGIWGAAALLAALGFFGQSFPAIMSHGRAFFPAHLVGRGVTFVNMFGIAGAGAMQFASGRLYAWRLAETGEPAQAFAAIWLFFLVPVVAGLGLYLFSRDARG
ncbi:MFS transporter [Frigidibacter sp. MR17.14]|uniref:MFS transporter n=1 Tax=Frigidibacter sp. MR17.14 TaxID=3126509 RepID=UPI003012E053